jgi:hypothetical protein
MKAAHRSANRRVQISLAGLCRASTAWILRDTSDGSPV